MAQSCTDTFTCSLFAEHLVLIILHISGGLGNQMFQYAFGRATAIKLGVELKFELSDHTLIIHNGFELERLFNIQAIEATPADMKSVLGIHRYAIIRKFIKASRLKLFNSPIVQEPHFHYASQILNLKDISCVHGYWQSEKYFSDIVSQIRSDFSFKLPLSIENANSAEKIGKSNSISLHIRRNDFANDSKINATHGLCSLGYYKKAIQYITDRVENPCFFVFSDDLSWVKNNLDIKYPVDFVEHNQGADSYNDMRLMSMCKHHIIANSSFSWWGAWLNSKVDKIVVAPKQWFANGADTNDLIPESWIRL